MIPDNTQTATLASPRAVKPREPLPNLPVISLLRLGHTNSKDVLPHPLQLALFAPGFDDVIVFRSPPLAVQRVVLGALAPIASWRGYRATYPPLSRTILAPRT